MQIHRYLVNIWCQSRGKSLTSVGHFLSSTAMSLHLHFVPNNYFTTRPLRLLSTQTRGAALFKWHLRRLVSKARVKDLRINLCVLNGVQCTTAGSLRGGRAKTGCPSNCNDFECTTVGELTMSHMRQIKRGIDKCILSFANDSFVLFIPD